MKTVICDRYGPPEVLRLDEKEKPKPGNKEVLIRVRATSVTTADCLMRRCETLAGRLILGILRPRKRFRTMGLELSGVVESTGRDVGRFHTGDRIYGFTGFAAGAYAQYACLPEKASIAPMPDHLTFQEAAALVDGATTALYFLKDRAGIKAGDAVLVIGASGSIGTAAVQLAKDFGANVTGVCSTDHVDLVTSLGADNVIDRTQIDYTQTGESYDIIFDTVSKSTYSACRGMLNDGGRYLTTVGGPQVLLLMAWTALFGSRRLIHGYSVEKKSALEYLGHLIEEGRLKPVIDRIYTMADIVDAHRYVETGKKGGAVIVDSSFPSSP